MIWQLTSSQRRTLSVILILFLLGLIGLATLEAEAASPHVEMCSAHFQR